MTPDERATLAVGRDFMRDLQRDLAGEEIQRQALADAWEQGYGAACTRDDTTNPYWPKPKSDCAACEWVNPWARQQDGSRGAAWAAHQGEAHGWET